MVKIRSSVQKTLVEQMRLGSWSAFRLDCIKYADKRIVQHIWFGAKGGVPPNGKTGSDIFDLVIKKIQSGRLNCKPDVDFKAFMFRTIRAEISLLAKSKKNLKFISDQLYSNKSMKGFSLYDFTPSNTDEHNKFYSKYSDGFIEQILNDFLNGVRNDKHLAMITKVFVYSGVVFEDSFEGIVYNPKALVQALNLQGYIDENGEVQHKFWQLTDATQFELPQEFLEQRKMIFLMIHQSLNVEKPKDIASWLNMDIKTVYAMKQKMNRYIKKFKKDLFKGDYEDEK